MYSTRLCVRQPHISLPFHARRRIVGEISMRLSQLLHHGEGATCLAKKAKHQRYGSPHFLIRVQNGPALPVIAEPNRKGKCSSPFFALLSLPPRRRPRNK